jgi:choline dehydrogenase
VAEKAADLILGNTPLPAEKVPYYRHRDDSPLYPPGDSRNAIPQPISQSASNGEESK